MLVKAGWIELVSIGTIWSISCCSFISIFTGRISSILSFSSFMFSICSGRSATWSISPLIMKIRGIIISNRAIARIIAADREGETNLFSFLSIGLKMKARITAPKKALR